MNGESACLGAAMDPISSHGTAAANSELIPPASELSSAGLTLLERLRGSDPGSAVDSRVGRSTASGSPRESSPNKPEGDAKVPPLDASHLGSAWKAPKTATSQRGTSTSDSSSTSSTFSEQRPSGTSQSVSGQRIQPKQRPSLASQGYVELFDSAAGTRSWQQRGSHKASVSWHFSPDSPMPAGCPSGNSARAYRGMARGLCAPCADASRPTTFSDYAGARSPPFRGH